VLKDFLHVAGQLRVTHFMILTATDTSTHLRIGRVPRGPTLTFNVSQYSLIRDLATLQLRPHAPGLEFHTPPLVVLSNFPKDTDHFRVAGTMLQNMFPALNVQEELLIPNRISLLELF
jgi:ribosome biogenesis protein SSF1/2